MSKNQVNKKEEEEWEDVEEEEQEEDEDTTINNSDVVVKFKKSAQWANEVLQALIDATKAGAKVADLCAMGDALIATKVATMFKGVDKGIAFPTSVSVNNCVAHNSPSVEDENQQVIANGDIVHIDLGIHVDGYPAVVAHTVFVSEDATIPDTKEGNVIQAAYTALQTAVRSLRPGTKMYEVTEVIEKVAAHFGVNCADGVLSHQIKQYIVDGARCIPCKKAPEYIVHDYSIEPAQVWSLDIVFTTGKGKLKEKDTRCSIFKQSLESNYQPKMESARALLQEVNTRFQVFPFAVRNVENKKARLGLSEMLKHGVVTPYPVLYEKEGEAVAHFKITTLITAKKIERVTGLPLQKATKAIAPFTDEALLTASKLPFSLEPKKEKK
eukprot:GILI01005201.1.p2 GENE.GILI01005201.1~~GILI01005201.1.p2  ORF type:complete len:383 (+),score=166.93 GILI01005201.1:36-1184(+)